MGLEQLLSPSEVDVGFAVDGASFFLGKFYFDVANLVVHIDL